MSMKILKASAGSGKTFSLAKEYITLLLKSDSPDAYRHVLAVTFTNKATDEMKRRILKELHTLASNPSKSPYLDALVPSVVATSTELQHRSEAMLTGILHDYGSFAVSTIDKFFQQTLRAFSREIGQFAAYQVELDKDALVDETVEKVLNGLSTHNSALLDWVIRGVKHDLQVTGRFTLDKRLKDMAENIVSIKPDNILQSHEDLGSLKDTCSGIVAAFTAKVSSTAAALVEAIEASGVNPGDTNRGFLKAVYDYLKVTPRELIELPTASFMDKASDPEKWFAKTKANLRGIVEPYISGALDAFVALFGREYREYATAKTIDSQIYGLGMAAELREAFTEVQKERGVISIEDTNSILHDIIDGTDAPFLYEKLGVRFEDFLLDEFQDTSGVQWDNFLPLLQNSNANGNDNLVVGDVKQSIYRWRGSQWDLLDSRLQNEFRVPANDIAVLDGNYRTCREIVNFNNSFFPFAASEIDRLIGNSPTSPSSVTSIYSDVIQDARTKEQAKGMVNVCFVEDTAKELDKVVESILHVKELGAHNSDIAILVRGNADGAAVASRLVEEGIPVISDDSLFVKSSVTVRRLVSQLAIVDNPALAESNGIAGYLAKELQLTVPKTYHGLTDLCEEILAELKSAAPELFAAETPFIQAFADWLKDWTYKNGNNLSAMLHDWSEVDPKISSPEGNDAVRVMTVHKSKGLEFPYVIFPFAEKVTLYKPASYWCTPKAEGSALERVSGKQFRASLSEGSVNTLFAEDYVKERSQQAVDNINVFYVAMTRAKYGLCVISGKPTKGVIDAVEAGKEVPAKSLAHLLYAFVHGQDYSAGEPYDFSAMRRESQTMTVALTFECNSEPARRRLVFRTSKHSDFLAEENGPAPEDNANNEGALFAGPESSSSIETETAIVEPTLF